MRRFIIALCLLFPLAAQATDTQAILVGKIGVIYGRHGFIGSDLKLMLDKTYGMPRLYDTAANLAADATQNDGTLGYALDTHAIYVWENNAWQGVTVASGGNSSISGTLGVSGITTLTGRTNANGGIDVTNAGALAIGANTATSTHIGATATPVVISSTGAIAVPSTATVTGTTLANGGVDVTSGALAIGATNATTVNIGATATPVAVTSAGALTAPAAIKSTSASGGIGYATGAGCTIGQASSVTTGVTCTGTTGQITTYTETAAQNATVSFTVTDTSVALHDAVIVSVQMNNGAGLPVAFVTAVAAGSFQITIDNLSASSLNNTLVLNFVVVKGVAS